MNKNDKLPHELQEQAEQFERMRRDFVANVSHELRTPLTVLLGYIEAIQQKKAEFPQQWHRIFDQMKQHGLRMQTLVEDLLLLSQLEATSVESEEWQIVDVPKMIEALAEDARNISGEDLHQIRIDINYNVKLQGHENELKSLFGNLIVNAVKYTPPKGDIFITWNIKNGRAYFCVKDTGIGISKNHLPRITERFYRVDKARSRASGGTGLGLAIVKHVLLRHHGKLKVISQEGVGSEFCCWFQRSFTM